MQLQWWCVAQASAWDWQWRPYPGVWLFLAALVGLRWVVLRRAGGEDGCIEPGTGRATGADGDRWRDASFGAGILFLWLALDWPLGALGASYLASAHMVQFLLVAMVAPPFLLLGVPSRAFYGASVPVPLERPLRILSHPVVALATFAVMLAVTHWPLVVDAVMTSQLGSFALDMVWLGSGLLFWWPVVAPRPRRWWFPLPAKIGYLIVATVANTGVFMYLTYSELPLYGIYELAPPIAWLSSRDDQLLAGLLMKMGGGIVLWIAITILFGRWYVVSERTEERQRAGQVS